MPLCAVGLFYYDVLLASVTLRFIRPFNRHINVISLLLRQGRKVQGDWVRAFFVSQPFVAT